MVSLHRERVKCVHCDSLDINILRDISYNPA